jgi:hypothetical protein
MPSRSSAARKAATDRLFSWAMRSIVRSSVASSTLMPVSFASWTCTRSLISRSRIWRESASAAGSWPPWRWNWRTTRFTRSVRSLNVITSSLTTATMRSTGTTRGGGREGGAWRGRGSGSGRLCRGGEGGEGRGGEQRAQQDRGRFHCGISSDRR